jgi:hypothetical protein
MYVCTYVYVCMYACMYVCVYVCMYVRTYVRMCGCMYVLCMYVCVYVCMYICMYVCTYVCMYCLYVCMYVCMYLCRSVRPSHDITRLTTDGFSWNFILQILYETCHDPTRLKSDTNSTLWHDRPAHYVTHIYVAGFITETFPVRYEHRAKYQWRSEHLAFHNISTRNKISRHLRQRYTKRQYLVLHEKSTRNNVGTVRAITPRTRQKYYALRIFPNLLH